MKHKQKEAGRCLLEFRDSGRSWGVELLPGFGRETVEEGWLLWNEAFGRGKTRSSRLT